MKKKLLILIPTIILFTFPWMHWLIYHNIMLAWPMTPSESAHILAGLASLIAGSVTFGLTAS